MNKDHVKLIKRNAHVIVRSLPYSQLTKLMDLDSQIRLCQQKIRQHQYDIKTLNAQIKSMIETYLSY